jgi:flagellar biosynthesis protein FlhF
MSDGEILTFLAPTMREALVKAKENLGDDAVILHTRQVPARGLLPGKSLVEITATVSSAAANDAKEDVPSAQRAVATTSTSVLEDQVRRLQRLVDRLSGVADRQQAEAASQAAEPGFADYLRSIDLPEVMIQECVVVAGDLKDAAAVGRVVDYLTIRFRAHSATTADLAPPAMALVGPTGVGKTTTLVKLALRAEAEFGKPAALVSTDDERVGGRQEIRRYAEILDVPCLQARSRADLDRFIELHQSERIVLIDTPGRSPVESVAIQSLSQLLQGLPTLLVLSAHARESALRAAIDAFRTLDYEQLVFTKLDETPGTGAIAGLAAMSPVPVRYVGLGQNVHDDLQRADPRWLARWALGDWASRPAEPIVVDV